MSDGLVQLPPDSTGKKIDAASLDVATNTVLRQRIVLADNSASAEYATVNGGALHVAIVSGSVAIDNTAIAAFATPQPINHISRTVTVAVTSGMLDGISAPVVLAAGTANIGYINDISATIRAVLAAGTANIGAVSLVAGTSNIGFINNISATVNVAMATTATTVWATPQTVNNISATVVTGLSYVVEKTTNSQVQVGDSANAAIRVNIVAGAVGGSGGTSQQDGTSFDTQTALMTPVGGIFDDASSNTLSENDAGVVRMTTNRAFHVNMRTDGGAKMEDSANTALRVNVVAGSASGPSIIDNATYSTGATSITPAGFMFFSASAVGMTDGRMGAARITEFRGLHVNLRANDGTEVGTAAAPLSTKVERISATASVVLAAGTANVGTINDISKTVSVVVAAGTANIGTINDISRTVSVVNAAGTANIGGVSLVAGTANIGFINNISATVNVAFAGGISLAAGTANIGFINNISATVAVVLAAGTANFGTLNNISRSVEVVISGTPTINNISRTVEVVVSTPFTVDAISATVTVTTTNPWVVAAPSSSHGPKMVVISTSTTATIIVAPGAGNFVYVTSLAVSNGGTVNTEAHVGPSVSTSYVTMFLQSAGGGFVMNFDPPWRLPGNEALLGYVNPNSSGNCYFNVNFFVRDS